jgi:hypothetical protein
VSATWDSPRLIQLFSRELENEARRIVEVDFKIPLEFYPPPAEPDSNVDVNLLDSEIHASLRYAASPRGIQTPSLAEDVGVFVSDGLVPVNLHREVRIIIIITFAS